jgi:hypothetical protein
MVQLFEVVLIEVREEPRRAGCVTADLEVVDVEVPIVADVRDGRCAGRWHGRLL